MQVPPIRKAQSSTSDKPYYSTGSMIMPPMNNKNTNITKDSPYDKKNSSMKKLTSRGSLQVLPMSCDPNESVHVGLKTNTYNLMKKGTSNSIKTTNKDSNSLRNSILVNLPVTKVFLRVSSLKNSNSESIKISEKKDEETSDHEKLKTFIKQTKQSARKSNHLTPKDKPIESFANNEFLSSEILNNTENL